MKKIQYALIECEIRGDTSISETVLVSNSLNELIESIVDFSEMGASEFLMETRIGGEYENHIITRQVVENFPLTDDEKKAVENFDFIEPEPTPEVLIVKAKSAMGFVADMAAIQKF